MPQDSGKKKVLIVEDNALLAMGLESTLEDLGLTVCGIAASAKEASDSFTAQRPDLVVMDLRLYGDEDGVDAAQFIHSLEKVPIIFITGSNDRASVERIMQDYPASILFKPVHPDRLAQEVARVLEGS